MSPLSPSINHCFLETFASDVLFSHGSGLSPVFFFGSQELPTKLNLLVNCYNTSLDIQSRTMHGYRLRSSLLAISWKARLMTFVLNILVTLCMDSLGFIQTASLRWSLHREGRLNFNSNLRLLTATKDNLAHRW